MIKHTNEITDPLIANLLKILTPSLLIGSVKAMIMIKDKKVSIANATLSCLISVILSITLCFPLQEVLSSLWLLGLNSLLTLAGENIFRAIIYKNDWNIIVDTIVDHLLVLLKIKK